MPNPLIPVARVYLQAGLSAFPAVAKDKFPTGLPWAQYQTHLMDIEDAPVFFRDADAICIICGEASGGLEGLDFDDGGSAFSEWLEKIPPELADRLVIERTPSGGFHVFYRCTGIAGNTKLARKITWVDGPEEVEVAGKRYKPRRHGGRWFVETVLIETRGRGGLVVCAPTAGYELVQGDFEHVPLITPEERDLLWDAARSFDQTKQVKQPATAPEKPADVPPAVEPELQPWDDYNQRGDFRAVLQRAGWSMVRGTTPSDDNERWRRPGKEDGHSATINSKGLFYCWSSSAAPFREGQAYSPFQVYTLLEHNEDVGLAVDALRREGYGREGAPVDLSGILGQARPAPPELSFDDIRPQDDVSATIPNRLLYPGGMLGDVVDYTLATSLYQQPEIALAGAISLLSVLTGRRVKDFRNTRTNVYVLTVNPPRSGKERPREVNKDILYEANAETMIGNERIGSHAGIITAVEASGSILFQIDEMGRFMATTRDPRNSHLYNVTSVLLTLYSAVTNVWKADAYADLKKGKTIYQPHFVLFGTTTAETLWPNMSRENVSDGLVGRLLIFEGRGYVDFNENYANLPVPQKITDAARWWVGFTPGETEGNLARFVPRPALVPHTPAANAMYLDHVRDINTRRKDENPFRAAVWSGTAEKTAKLALIHACSRAYGLPEEITEDDVEWAKGLANHLTRRMLTSCVSSLAENETHAKYQKVLRIVGDQKIPKAALCRKLQWLSGREREQILKDLLDTGQLNIDPVDTSGRRKHLYFQPRHHESKG